MMTKIYNTIITYAVTMSTRALMWICEKCSKTDRTWRQYNRMKDVEQSLTSFYNVLHFSNVSDNARDRFIAEFRKYVSYVNSYGDGFLI